MEKKNTYIYIYVHIHIYTVILNLRPATLACSVEQEPLPEGTVILAGMQEGVAGQVLVAIKIKISLSLFC